MEFEVSIFGSNKCEREYEGEEEINHTCKNFTSQGTLSLKMASVSNENVQENVDEVVENEYFDQEIFKSPKCTRWFNKNLAKNITQERGIILDNLEARWPDFYRRLMTSGWMCFAAEPIKANYTIVREFYANATESDFANDLVVTVRGKQVRFDSERINAYYNLPNGDNDVHRERGKELGTEWFVTNLHGGKMPKWIANNLKIESSEFTAEARTWLSILCARVLPSKNETEVTLERARIICAVMDGLPVDVGQFIVQEIHEVVMERTKSLFFPSLITYLCQQDGVIKKDGDREKGPEKPIHPLKKRAAGNAQKKRNIDVASPSFGRFPDSTGETSGSTAAAEPMEPLRDGAMPFRYIFTQVHDMDTHIRQLVAGLPSGPVGEGFSTLPSGSNALTLLSVVQELQHIKERLRKIEMRQKKQREHEKKKSKFLTNLISTLRQFCGAQDDDVDEHDFVLSEPSSSSSE
ncbi:uncharacterized protein LOC132609529 isoform X2 [Lycium barbarum]|nr:uncharacterized protein LOC132609529 isoform X2 [Lycium barbarum]